MVLGQGSLKKKNEKAKKDSKKGSQEDEAKEILAKMQQKRENEDCPFC